MSNYFVLHCRKIRTEVGCIEVLKHNLRKKKNLEEFIDINKSIFNFYDGATVENFIEKFKELISNLPRKIQKNASRLIEFVVSFSHEYGEEWESNPELKKKIENFFNDVEKFLRKRYGFVIISRTDHYDEKTPHSHLLLVPLCKNKNDVIRFSSSEFLGGINGLYDLHDKFEFEVGKKYGLKRGTRGERTKHSDLKSYAEWEKEQRRYIEEQRKLLDQQLEDAHRQQELNAKNENFVKEERKKQFDQRGKLLKETAMLDEKEREFELLDNCILEQTPQIPIPPVQFTEKSRKQWVEKVQKMINLPFSKIIKGYFYLKKKCEKLSKELKELSSLYQQYKTRAERAEKDLEEKPINEILSMREEAKKTEQKNKKENDHGGSSL